MPCCAVALKPPDAITYNSIGLGNGTPTLTAKAFGAAGNTTTSAVVDISVNKFAPVVNFDASISGLIASFTDASLDMDGTIESRTWNFGDGTNSATTKPSHTYAVAGNYTVTLTATDNTGLTNNRSQTIDVGNSTVQVYSNPTDVAIADNAIVTSSILVSGRAGKAPIAASVEVNIIHTYIGDLKVNLIAPDGSV